MKGGLETIGGQRCLGFLAEALCESTAFLTQPVCWKDTVFFA
jgi:hypothetical protein